MSASSEDTPEALAQLRTTVEDWLKKAKAGVETFYRRDDVDGTSSDNGTFLLDNSSDGQDRTDFNTTTTARSYMALASADWRLADADATGKRPNWINWLEAFLASQPYWVEGEKFLKNPGRFSSSVVSIGDEEKKTKLRLNNFDVVHLADYVFVSDYISRFYGQNVRIERLVSRRKGHEPFALEAKNGQKEIRDLIAESVRAIISEAVLDDNGNARTVVRQQRGQALLDPAAPESRHFFVSLHALRAVAILDQKHNILEFESKGQKFTVIDRLMEQLEQYCVEQCFYAQRKNRHEYDSLRVVFATVAYCLYVTDPDKDLCIACLEALESAQQPDGSWRATHPIIRKQNRPWHITSHEIALCLTWLYFQPRVPAIGRMILLRMMERYFKNWVIHTFVRVRDGRRTCTGWFDDHTITRDSTSAWATAIVCHFLANYHAVLSNYLNRRGIESLGIEASSVHYRVDEEAHKPSPRWTIRTKIHGSSNEVARPTWPDLPPFAWSDIETDADGMPNEAAAISRIAKLIRWRWSDPQFISPDGSGSISQRLASRVLVPILSNPAELPERSVCSGILPGSPGTRKTTLVQTVARIVRWPLVTVPASVFFDQGFDMIESRANEIFRRLNYLSNCVIFFDEFEEFFRDRSIGQRPRKDARASTDPTEKPRRKAPSKDAQQSIHDRTIAAFITSSMLPRVQDLHDQRRCLIFLATNSEEAIDEAIRRPGRFDFRIEVGHPTSGCARAYLAAPTCRTYQEVGCKVDDDGMKVFEADKPKYDAIAKEVIALIEGMPMARQATPFRFKDLEDALRIVGKSIASGQMLTEQARKDAIGALTRKLEEATPDL